ncbi:la-related protein 4 isoform X3 [Nematostella vectensis]|uniref:la-related protein 4 isoform X3 n=1 Tax=Nematostella vectensis TaxID=45351 RepID=UPI002077012E|nr:la-related protein 4 isoform X3 [Nematostella vectensis]
MSSEITSTTGEIPTTLSEPIEQVTINSTDGVLNPNAAVFDSFSLMTLSDKSPASETSPLGVPTWQDNPEIPQSPIAMSAEMIDTLQYSPEPAVNGYGPYTSPGVAPEVVQGLQDMSPDKLPRSDLKNLLQHQLEYYFSRENLSRDTYLLSQMDRDNYVPIWTVANFNQVKKLTKDLELVKEALRDSPHLQVDSLCEKVRANIKRCIVVLREIPETTPIEEVKALFAGENCPQYQSCEFALNEYWYIQFETEEDAQKAYKYLREEVKTFRGKPIMARIKAKPMHQANFVPKNARISPSSQSQTPPVVEPPVPPPTPPQALYNQRHFQFPPVQPLFNGQQPFQYYPAHPGMMTWPPPGQHVYHDPHVSPSFPNNGFGHGPMKAPREIPGSSAIRHGYQLNRTRFQNKPHHRDQPSGDRPERDSNRTRPQSANGSSSHSPLNNPPTTSSPGNASSSGNSTTSPSNTRDGQVARNSVPFRTREARESEFTRQGRRPVRQRRGSSEDISRHNRQKENRESPVRHSKDDSDTLDLAPSSFPPLPASPLTQPIVSAKDFPEIKANAKPQTPEKPMWKIPVATLTNPPLAKQEAPQPIKPAEKPPKPAAAKEPVPVKPEPKPETKPEAKQEAKPEAKQVTKPIVQEEAPRTQAIPKPGERMSYAQMAAQKGPKPAANPQPANVQTKSPGK